MNLRRYIQAIYAGMALFSMFFGGGNLIFPILIGIESSHFFASLVGFLTSGVLLPLYAILISLFFKGNYEAFLNSLGKRFGSLLIFLLLIFWIPFGSGPRCILLAYGTVSYSLSGIFPLWVFSGLYSLLVYFLCFRKSIFLDILGKWITPLLIICMGVLITGAFIITPAPQIHSVSSPRDDFLSSFLAGYNTMDFIAAIFFSSVVFNLIKEKQKGSFSPVFNYYVCLVAMLILSGIYLGMIFVGHTLSSSLSSTSIHQLLPTIGSLLLNEHLALLIFFTTFLSVFSTSMALSFVFAEYLQKNVFQDRGSHSLCLLIPILLSYFLSIIGIDRLSILISYAMSLLYPILIVVTTYGLLKAIFIRNYQDNNKSFSSSNESDSL